MAIKNLLPLISPNYGIVNRIFRVVHYSDEPKFFKFIATIGDSSSFSDGKNYKSTASGFSFSSEEEALVKCIGESLERFSLKVYKKKDLVYGSFQALNKSAYDPKSIVAFSDRQKRKKSFTRFIFDDSSKFYWVKGRSLIWKKQFLVPAQLVYTSYLITSNEQTVRLPISTGAAGGNSLESALCRGAYEIIERDAFMIFYLNKLKPSMVNLNQLRDEKISEILYQIERYNLELYTLDLTTDLDIPTFLSIAIDRTGIGPAVSVGLKSHLEPGISITGSIQEALHSRAWIRKEVEDDPTQVKRVNPRFISDLKERGVFWYPKKRIGNLNFLFKQKPNSSKKYILNRPLTAKQQLKTILRRLRRKSYDFLYADIGLPYIKDFGYEVVRVIIPELQPLFLDEKYPYFGGKRLYTVPKLLGFSKKATQEEKFNRFPHPFL